MMGRPRKWYINLSNDAIDSAEERGVCLACGERLPFGSSTERRSCGERCGKAVWRAKVRAGLQGVRL